MATIKQDAIVVVDGAYALKGAKGRRLRFDALDSLIARRLKDEFNVAIYRRFYFNAVPDPPVASQRGFHKSLMHLGWQVKLNELKRRNVVCHDPSCRNCNHSSHLRPPHPIQDIVQAGVDVRLATHILTLAAEDRYTLLVLLAGDGDFKDAIDWISNVKHKSVWLLAYPDSVSAELKQYANLGFTDLSTLPDLFQERPPRQAPPGAMAQRDRRAPGAIDDGLREESDSDDQMELDEHPAHNLQPAKPATQVSSVFHEPATASVSSHAPSFAPSPHSPFSSTTGSGLPISFGRGAAPVTQAGAQPHTSMPGQRRGSASWAASPGASSWPGPSSINELLAMMRAEPDETARLSLLQTWAATLGPWTVRHPPSPPAIVTVIDIGDAQVEWLHQARETFQSLSCQNEAATLLYRLHPNKVPLK